MDNTLTQLHRWICEHYDQEELRTLCFDLGVDYDSLPAQGKAAKARELILVLGRRRELASLFAALQATHAGLLAETGLEDDVRTGAMLQAQLAAFERRTSVDYRSRRPPFQHPATPTYVRPRRSRRRRALAVAVILMVLGGLILSILTQPWSGSAGATTPEDPSAALPLEGLVWIAQLVVSFILLLAAVAELSGWNVRELLGTQPAGAGAEAFPFHVVRDFEELLDYVFPDPSIPRLPDRAVPFLPRIADRLDTAFRRGGRVLIRGRSKTGKTREAVEALRRWWRTGPTVLLAKNHVGLYPPYAVPDTLPVRNLVLFFDDVDRYCGDDDAVGRLGETIAFFAGLCHDPAELRVIATARQEPEFWRKLHYEAQQAPWDAFDLLVVKPLSSEGSRNLLQHLAERAGIEVTPAAATDIAHKNDGTFLALILSFRGWLEEGLQRVGPAQAAAFEGELVAAWQARYRRLVQAMPAAGPIYAAVDLLQHLDVPLRPALVTELATEMQLSRGYHLLAGLFAVARQKIELSPRLDWYRERGRRRRGLVIMALLAVLVLYLSSYLLLRFVPSSIQVDFFNALAAELWVQLALLSPLLLLLIPLGLSLGLRWRRQRSRQRVRGVLDRLMETEIPLRGEELRPYENQFEGNGASRTWRPGYYAGQAGSGLFRRLAAPRLATVYGTWAEQLRVGGDVGPARSLARLARRLAPAHPAPLFLVGQLWYDEGQIRRAMVEFTRARELDPTANAARALERVAWCLYHLADYEQVEAVASQALAWRADLAPARWVRGLARLQRGQVEAGLDDCRRAALEQEAPVPEVAPALEAALAQPTSRGWANRVRRLLQQGRARPTRRVALRRKLVPGLAVGLLALSVIALLLGVPYLINRVDEDARFNLWFMDIVLTLYPDAPVPIAQRGGAYYVLGDYERAVADYTAALLVDPEYPWAYAGRSWAYKELGEYERAIADLTEVIRLDPDDAVSYKARADVYEDMGAYERAIADYTEAIRLDPEYEAAYNNRGYSFSQLGEYKRAIADLTEVIRLDPNDDEFYAIRGYFYWNSGDYERAITDFTEAIRLDPDDGAAYHYRGSAYRALENHAAALADFRRFLELEPDFWNREQVEAWIAELEARLAEP
jgi:tetratricopeptide (TPR) repeat protein